jgi:hypothetical protein
VWPDQNSGQQLTNHRWLADAVEQLTSQLGGGEHDE